MAFSSSSASNVRYIWSLCNDMIRHGNDTFLAEYDSSNTSLVIAHLDT